MALYSCPDCGAQVSGQALKCPHCGRPKQLNASQFKERSIFTLDLGTDGIVCCVVIVVGILMLGFGGMPLLGGLVVLIAGGLLTVVLVK